VKTNYKVQGSVFGHSASSNPDSNQHNQPIPTQSTAHLTNKSLLKIFIKK